MDQLKKNEDFGNEMRQGSRNRDFPQSVRSRGAGAFEWASPAAKPLSLRRIHDSQPESELHEPKLLQLNPKSSLAGDDEEHFFSRQSSMSSMSLSENFRSRGVAPAPFKWEAEGGKGVEYRKSKIDIPSAPRMMAHPGRRVHSGSLYSQPFSAFNLPPSGKSTRLPSGMLYPCPNPGSKPNSCQLHAAHFTFDNVNMLTPDLQGGSHDDNNLTERIFKKLVGQSRLNRCSLKGEEDSSGNLEARGDDLSDSPVSTLDCPQSPTFSERSFRGKSKRKSLRRRSEDANSIVAAQGGPIDSTTPRPKSQLAQYLMSITALTSDATDDDDLEGPSEVAWLEPDENLYEHPDRPGGVERKPTHERWSSNSSSWNLSLVPKPLRTVSTIVGRKHHQQHATIPGSSAKKVSRRSKVDAILPISLTMSYDGASIHSRALRKGTRSEVNSGRSWWPELNSGRKSNMWACSGRLQMDVAAEPDLHEPDMEQANNVKARQQQQDARAKVDEDDFPFEIPIASSFVFQEALKSRMPAIPREQGETRGVSLHKAVVSVVDSETSELQFSDNYHDPEEISTTDSDGSRTFSLEREGLNGAFEQASEWNPSQSFGVVDGGGFSRRALSGLSGSALSEFLDLGRSGRFSVDLQRGQKLDKAQYPRTPEVRLTIVKSEKASRRSILSPCLPFLHRSHKHEPVPSIPQSPEAVAVEIDSSRRLQPGNSFTARLGPVAEHSTLAGLFQLQP